MVYNRKAWLENGWLGLLQSEAIPSKKLECFAYCASPPCFEKVKLWLSEAKIISRIWQLFFIETCSTNPSHLFTLPCQQLTFIICRKKEISLRLAFTMINVWGSHCYTGQEDMPLSCLIITITKTLLLCFADWNEICFISEREMKSCICHCSHRCFSLQK